MRRFLTASAALLALVAAASTAMGADVVPASSTKIDTQKSNTQQAIGREALAYYGTEITRLKIETWHWQRVTGARLTPAPARTLSSLTPEGVQRTATEWRIRLAEAHENALHPPHLKQFLCIHRYEGSWTDTGEPYYGGLQMDRSFQQAYGGWLYATKGTADHWSPIEQIWTAEKALKSRGYWPWPNTARYCGLL